jgi:hypothetical protein
MQHLRVFTFKIVITHMCKRQKYYNRMLKYNFILSIKNEQEGLIHTIIIKVMT